MLSAAPRMVRIPPALFILPALFVLFTGSAAGSENWSLEPGPDTVVTLGTGPTLVAFVGASRMEVMYSADWSAILTGFLTRMGEVRPDLERLPIAIEDVYATSITFRSGSREWRMSPAPDSLLVGYYLWAPDGPRYICTGDLTGAELLATVAGYLARVRTPSADPVDGCDPTSGP